MTGTTATLAELPALKGSELGTSDWFEVTQQRVNTFADATGDHQWIHVDVEEIKDGYQLTVAAAIEREGSSKPVCIAEPVFRFYR
jgi:acyl dehydratase